MKKLLKNISFVLVSSFMAFSTVYSSQNNTESLYKQVSLKNNTELASNEQINPHKQKLTVQIHKKEIISNEPVYLDFNQPLVKNSIQNKNMVLIGQDSKIKNWVLINNKQRIQINPEQELLPNAEYAVVLKDITAQSGDKLPLTTLNFHVSKIVANNNFNNSKKDKIENGQTNNSPLLTADKIDNIWGLPNRDYIENDYWHPGANNLDGNWIINKQTPPLPVMAKDYKNKVKNNQTALYGQILTIAEKPVSGVEISNGKNKTISDKDGLFLLPVNLDEKGNSKIYVNGNNVKDKDGYFGQFSFGYHPKPHQINTLTTQLFIPKVRYADEINISSPSEEMALKNSDIPGLEIQIPKGTIFQDHNGKIIKKIAIVPVPNNRAPYPVKNDFPVYFSLQPSGALIKNTEEKVQGIKVIYPNYAHAKKDTVAEFSFYDDKQGWIKYGKGKVSEDGKEVIPDQNTIAYVSTGMSYGIDASTNPADPSLGICPTCKGDPVDLFTGVFFHQWQDIFLKGAVPVDIERTYRNADTTYRLFGLSGSMNYDMYLERQTSDTGLLTMYLVMPTGQTVAFNRIGTTTVWKNTDPQTSFYNVTISHNETNNYGFLGSNGNNYVLTLKNGIQWYFSGEDFTNFIGMKDRNGNNLVVTRIPGTRNISSIYNNSGTVLNFTYGYSGTHNHISSIVDQNGRTVNYTYNTNDLLTQVTYPDSTTENYTYDSSGNMLTATDRNGNTALTNTYTTLAGESYNRVATQTYANGGSYSFNYNSCTNTTPSAYIELYHPPPTEVGCAITTDPAGVQTKVVYNSSGLVSSKTIGYGTGLAQTTTYSYDSNGVEQSETDALGRTTSYTYDSNYNLSSVTYLSGTANAATYSFTYSDPYFDLVSVTNPLNYTTTYGVDGNGNYTSITDPLNHTTTINYGNGTNYYLPKQITSPSGNYRSIAYTNNYPSSVSDSLGETATISYDAYGNAVSNKDPLGNITTNAYNVNNRITGKIDALHQTHSFTYDSNQNPTSYTDPNSNSISWTYNNINKVSSRTDQLSHSDSYTYNLNGSMATHTDRNGNTTNYSYDAISRLSLITYSDGSTLTYSYDAGNRVTQVVDSITGTYSYTYNGLNEILSETTPSSYIAYTYDLMGRKTSSQLTGQSAITYGYDNANKLTSITQSGLTVSIQYDSDNRKIKTTLSNGTYITYSYDSVGRMSSIIYYNSSNVATGDLEYGYDSNSNIVSLTGSMAPDTLESPLPNPSTFNASNQMTTYGGTGASLTYDNNGNLTSDGTYTYVWDVKNRLIAINQGSTNISTFTYDPWGRRINKDLISSSINSSFAYDGNNIIQEIEGSTTKSYLNGLGLDERYSLNDGTNNYYFLTDHENSTQIVQDSSGNTDKQYSYSPYGETSLVDSLPSLSNHFTYTGREEGNGVTGLLYYRARYYSNVQKRFISEDPIGLQGGINEYAYVLGNPIGENDPLGLIGEGESLINDYPPNQAIYNSVQELNLPNTTVVGGHGNENGNLMAPDGKSPIYPGALAYEITHQQNYRDGQPIYLLICGAGKDYAKRLLKEIRRLGYSSNVYASPNFVYISQDGSFFTPVEETGKSKDREDGVLQTKNPGETSSSTTYTDYKPVSTWDEYQ